MTHSGGHQKQRWKAAEGSGWRRTAADDAVTSGRSRFDGGEGCVGMDGSSGIKFVWVVVRNLFFVRFLPAPSFCFARFLPVAPAKTKH